MMIRFVILCVVVTFADLMLVATIFDSRQSTLGYVSRALAALSIYSFAHKIYSKKPSQ